MALMLSVVGAATASASSWIVALVTFFAFGGAVAVALRSGASPNAAAFGSAPSRFANQLDLAPEPARFRLLESALLGVLMGYILFDRPFAWVHVPKTPLFVGEMVIGIGVLILLSSRTGVNSLIRSSGSLRILRNFMIWGALLLTIGVVPYGLDAIRDSAIWYYGIVAIFVAMLLVSDPRRVDRWLGHFATALPIYFVWFPIATVLAAVAPDNIFVPDSKVPIFFHRTGNMAVLAAIGIAFLWMADGDSRLFTGRQRAWLTTLATLVIGFTGLQNRGGMVAGVALIAALLFLLSKRRTEMVMMMAGVLVFFATVGIVFDVKIQLFNDRTISIEQFSQNITSIFDQDSGGYRQTETTAWRIRIWEQVLDDVTSESPVMGFGMGPDLGKRYGITTDANVPLRNPHNSHVGVLARMGWVGIILWAILWITWIAEMQTLRRRLRYRDRPRESAVVSWIMLAPIPILINAIFDPTLEGAQVSMLLWAFFGAGAGLVVLARQNRFPSLTATPRQNVDEATATTLGVGRA